MKSPPGEYRAPMPAWRLIFGSSCRRDGWPSLERHFKTLLPYFFRLAMGFELGGKVSEILPRESPFERLAGGFPVVLKIGLLGWAEVRADLVKRGRLRE